MEFTIHYLLLERKAQVAVICHFKYSILRIPVTVFYPLQLHVKDLCIHVHLANPVITLIYKIQLDSPTYPEPGQKFYCKSPTWDSLIIDSMHAIVSNASVASPTCKH